MLFGVSHTFLVGLLNDGGLIVDQVVRGRVFITVAMLAICCRCTIQVENSMTDLTQAAPDVKQLKSLASSPAHV